MDRQHTVPYVGLNHTAPYVDVLRRVVGADTVTAACLVLLAIAHSVLGETGILRPLLAATWTIEVPRWATERILRFAWHLTSLAWLALAAIVLGGSPLRFVAVMSLASAAIIFVMLRGHLAWPLFLLAGLAALRSDGLLDGGWLRAGALAAAAVLVAAAGLHVYWAFGGRWMFDRAAPPATGSGASFQPGRALTLLVAVALAVFASLVVAVADQRGPSFVRWLVGVGTAVFTIRAIGDTKVAGFTKSVRDTAFAEADDRWFTPTIVFIALGAAGALVA